jgi:hypothetical protein
VSVLPLAASVRALPLAIFGGVLAITLAITWWASRRTRTATEFWAAGRGISQLQNGLAISGDYMSAAAFLGVSGLMFLGGFDGFITGVAALVSFVPVLLLLAERMRNAGEYTMADVLAFRLDPRPARTAAAVGTLCVVAFYLVAQMIAAGALIEALAGLVPGRGDHHRRGDVGLRDLRRHARHHLGADHQGRAAVDRGLGAGAVYALEVRVEPVASDGAGGGGVQGGQEVPGPGRLLQAPARRGLDRHRVSPSAPPACPTS